jgi:hypothetical protein
MSAGRRHSLPRPMRMPDLPPGVSNLPPSMTNLPPARKPYLPRPVRVRMGAGGTPHAVDGRQIERVRESWLVEDRWWTGRPLRRRYWEVLDARGCNLVVFHDLCAGEWFAQVG